MQRLRNLNEEFLQNKILERRNEELLKLLEAWQTKNQNVPKLIKSLDMHEIENLMIRFYQVYNVPIALYDEDGKLLFSIGWTNICLKFHKNDQKNLINCKESIRLIKNRMADTTSFSFKCKNDINSIAIPVSIQGESLGTLVVSQFLYENEIPDETRLQQISYENRINYEEYKKVMEDLPVFKYSEVEKLTEYYILFSEMISYIASRNFQLQNQQIQAKQKKEIFSIFKEKLEEQSYIIKAIHQYLMQQNQEIEILRSELSGLLKKSKVDYKEKSLVEIQPG